MYLADEFFQEQHAAWISQYLRNQTPAIKMSEQEVTGSLCFLWHTSQRLYANELHIADIVLHSCSNLRAFRCKSAAESFHACYTSALIERGLIKPIPDRDGWYIIVGNAKRIDAIKESAARQKRYRERQKEKKSNDNVTVTLPSRNLYTDTDTDTENKKIHNTESASPSESESNVFKLKRKPKAGDCPITPGGFMDMWNDNCGSLPKISKMNEARIKKLKTRMASNPDVDYWGELITRMGNSKKIMAWQGGTWANVDWLLRDDSNHVKVFEGFYDDPEEKKKQSVMDEFLQHCSE